MKMSSVRAMLPREEGPINRFFDNCMKRKRLLDDVPDHHRKHLLKAKHDLARARAEFDDECWDWTVVMAYYAIHHAGNALLSREKGLFSKDHSCLIIALQRWDLITADFMGEMAQVHQRFADAVDLDLTFQLRKISQYSVDEWEDITREDAGAILEVAARLVRFVERGT
ncbi:MAG: HEPN domain-containing protein [Candidatus Undinarchaeales archaeon]|nr:HEPN domain-containing protein [Candidatus Undinarchaeales archaeon]MDP7494413.1 HEPN domain-containing protein [Candidatus Undinarchaeales archaeon]